MWWYVAIFVVALVIAYAMAPKPQNAKMAGISDVTAPSIEVGKEVQVLFGTRVIEDAAFVWYGDLNATAIKK